MISRRSVLIGTGSAALAGAGAWWWSVGPDYDEAANALWSQRPSGDIGAWIHYATLAANSHNAQPWRFRPTTAGVDILPDLSRALPVADPDDHHLYVSLGCAAENFMLAAGAAGRSSALSTGSDDPFPVQITLADGGTPDPLYASIPDRQCTRSRYDARLVAAAELARLVEAARVEGCEVMLIDDPGRREQVLELILAATAAQISDPAFVAELKSWLRFNARAAIGTGDGLYSACSGNPTLPTYLGRMMFDLVFKPEAEQDRYAGQVRSSAGLALFVSDRDDRSHWVQAGRSYQRFALQATALGIRHAHVNQPLEVAKTRTQLQSLLGLGERRPDLLVRYGSAAPMPRSLRRPLADVMAA